MVCVLVIKPATRQRRGVGRTAAFSAIPLRDVGSLWTNEGRRQMSALLCLQSSSTYVTAFDLLSSLLGKQGQSCKSHFTDKTEK